MKKATWKKTSFAEKIVEIIRTSPSINEMREQLQDYHDNDIAQSLQFLNVGIFYIQYKYTSVA